MSDHWKASCYLARLEMRSCQSHNSISILFSLSLSASSLLASFLRNCSILLWLWRGEKTVRRVWVYECSYLHNYDYGYVCLPFLHQTPTTSPFFSLFLLPSIFQTAFRFCYYLARHAHSPYTDSAGFTRRSSSSIMNEIVLFDPHDLLLSCSV